MLCLYLIHSAVLYRLYRYFVIYYCFDLFAICNRYCLLIIVCFLENCISILLLLLNSNELLLGTFTFMHLADGFIQSDLQCTQVIHIFVITCVP